MEREKQEPRVIILSKEEGLAWEAELRRRVDETWVNLCFCYSQRFGSGGGP